MKSEMTQQKQTDDTRRNKYKENCQINTTGFLVGVVAYITCFHFS